MSKGLVRASADEIVCRVDVESESVSERLGSRRLYVDAVAGAHIGRRRRCRRRERAQPILRSHRGQPAGADSRDSQKVRGLKPRAGLDPASRDCRVQLECLNQLIDVARVDVDLPGRATHRHGGRIRPHHLGSCGNGKRNWHHKRCDRRDSRKERRPNLRVADALSLLPMLADIARVRHVCGPRSTGFTLRAPGTRRAAWSIPCELPTLRNDLGAVNRPFGLVTQRRLLQSLPRPSSLLPGEVHPAHLRRTAAAVCLGSVPCELGPGRRHKRRARTRPPPVYGPFDCGPRRRASCRTAPPASRARFARRCDRLRRPLTVEPLDGLHRRTGARTSNSRREGRRGPDRGRGVRPRARVRAGLAGLVGPARQGAASPHPVMAAGAEVPEHAQSRAPFLPPSCVHM